MTHHDEVDSKTILGFWLYLLTDFMMFAALFATYAVLVGGTAGGPTGKNLFCLSFTLIQTLILLTGGFTSSLGEVMARRSNKAATLALFGMTLILGCLFLGMQMTEFSHLISKGAGWDRSAFLSAFFTLVGTFAVHIILALIWTVLFLWQVWQGGVTHVSVRRLSCLSMFWQFLNVVWVFIFSIVYLLGVQ